MRTWCMKSRGIYVNLNEHIAKGRTRRIGIFNPRLLIEALSHFDQVQLMAVEHTEGGFALAMSETGEDWEVVCPLVEVEE